MAYIVYASREEAEVSPRISKSACICLTMLPLSVNDLYVTLNKYN